MVVARTSANGHASGYNDIKYINGSAKPGNLNETQKTDLARWRLLDEQGRQTWHYLETEQQAQDWPQTTADRYHLGLPFVSGRS